MHGPAHQLHGLAPAARAPHEQTFLLSGKVHWLSTTFVVTLISMDDKALIKDLINTWAIAGDAGDWESFASVWHDDAWMTATWFQGPAPDFIAARKNAFESGIVILHLLGAHTSAIRGDRAIGQTKMQILQRAEIEGVPFDVTCTGRFYDFLEKRNGVWGIVRRQPIYEKDRLDHVDPSATLKLDGVRLNEYPEGYRHLAYLQRAMGYEVLNDLPGLRGRAVELLYSEGAEWLNGSATPGVPLSLKTRAGSPA